MIVVISCYNLCASNIQVALSPIEVVAFVAKLSPETLSLKTKHCRKKLQKPKYGYGSQWAHLAHPADPVEFLDFML